MDSKISYDMMGKIKSVNSLVKAALGVEVDTKVPTQEKPKKADVETTKVDPLLISEESTEEPKAEGTAEVKSEEATPEVSKPKKLSAIAKARREAIN
jgi:hypothetical protein